MKSASPAARGPLEFAREAARLTLTKRAEDVLILDLTGMDAVCDYFVLATGNSEVQVKAIADAVEEGMAAQGRKP